MNDRPDVGKLSYDLTKEALRSCFAEARPARTDKRSDRGGHRGW